MNNKEKNVIRHKLSDGLYIDPRLLRTGDNETEYFPFKPTEEECSPRPSVRGFGENGCLEVNPPFVEKIFEDSAQLIIERIKKAERI